MKGMEGMAPIFLAQFVKNSLNGRNILMQIRKGATGFS